MNKNDIAGILLVLFILTLLVIAGVYTWSVVTSDLPIWAKIWLLFGSGGRG